MLERAKKGVRLNFNEYYRKSADATAASDRAGEAAACRGRGTACQGGVVKDGQGLHCYVAYNITFSTTSSTSFSSYQLISLFGNMGSWFLGVGPGN